LGHRVDIKIMAKVKHSPIKRITSNLRAYYETYCSVDIVKQPFGSVKDPILRTRDHDYEAVIRGKK
jgi:hypothetical protein